MLARATRLSAAIIGLCACTVGGAAAASSLAYCQTATEPSAEDYDRVLQVANIVKQSLQQSGRTLALVARSGLNLHPIGHRYSHAGISLLSSPNGAWSVRQLYYACDEQRPRIFDQGMGGFVVGAHRDSGGFISLVLPPPQAAQALAAAAQDDRQALQLLGGDYSANAFAFSAQYQNCNQWVIELLASAWQASKLQPATSRESAQHWLASQNYQPSTIQLGWQPLIWVSNYLPWLHTDDHPQQDLEAAQFRVSMPKSIAVFVRQHLPETQHIELCYTAQHIVIRHGWEPLDAACEALADDERIPFKHPTPANALL